MNINHCPACGSDRLRVAGGPDSVAFKGLHVRVKRVLATECGNCGYAFVTPEQHDANVAAARAAHVKQRAADKIAKGLLTGAELRAMREALGLSQKEAADLFGGGPVAFSKYENEDVAQSMALDRLVRVVCLLGPDGVALLRSAKGKQVPAMGATISTVERVASVGVPAKAKEGGTVIFEVKRLKGYKRASELPLRSTAGTSYLMH